MQAQRDIIDIICFILETASNNSHNRNEMTHSIIYDTLLEHPRLTQYWAFLTEMGLLEHDITTQTFNITEKGLRFLKVLSKVDQNQKREQEE